MKAYRTFFLKTILRLAMAGVLTGLNSGSVHADPLLTSWFTANTGLSARVYTSAANRAAGIASTTWSGQTLPTYAGVDEIDDSPNWVYIRNTGLSSFVMGPWNHPN